MDRSDIRELHYITAISNLPSIVQRGILCHEKARKLSHEDIAMEDVQTTRAGITVPGGMRLHKYANFYFNARNVMMYKRRSRYQRMGVLSLKVATLDLTDVVVTDCNAASEGFAEYGSPAEMLPKLDYDEIFAERWDHADYFASRRHRARMCAEVLVPYSVPTSYIKGVYVGYDQGVAAVDSLNTGLRVRRNDYLFFRGPRP